MVVCKASRLSHLRKVKTQVFGNMGTVGWRCFHSFFFDYRLDILDLELDLFDRVWHRMKTKRWMLLWWLFIVRFASRWFRRQGMSTMKMPWTHSSYRKYKRGVNANKLILKLWSLKIAKSHPQQHCTLLPIFYFLLSYVFFNQFNNLHKKISLYGNTIHLQLCSSQQRDFSTFSFSERQNADLLLIGLLNFITSDVWI